MVGKIYTYDLSDESLLPMLPPDEKRDGERVISFSPDGNRAAVNWLERGQLRIGVYNFRTRELTPIKITPAYLQFFFLKQTLIWLSDEEFVCSALPDGTETGAVVFSRRAVGRALLSHWEDAWTGARPTAKILESHTGYPDWIQRAGSLVRVDARTGNVTKLADGVYFGLSLSPTGRYLAAARQGGWHQPDPGRPFRNEDFRTDYRRYDAVVIDLSLRDQPIRILPGFQIMLSRYTWSWGVDDDVVTFFAAEGDRRWGEGQYWLWRSGDRRASSVSLRGLELLTVREFVDYRFELAKPMWNGIIVPARRRAVSNENQVSPSIAMRDLSHGLSVKSSPSGPAESKINWYFVSAEKDPQNLTVSLKNVSPDLAGATRDAFYVLSDGGIWRVDRGNQPVNLTKYLNSELVQYSKTANINLDQLSRSKSRIKILAYTVDRRSLLGFDADGSTVASIRLPKNVQQLFALSPETNSAVIDPGKKHGNALVVISGKKRTNSILTYNDRLLNRLTTKPISLNYRLPDSTEMTSVAVLPTDWRPGKKVPVIVDVYPGQGETIGTALEVSHPLSSRLFASMGYAVLSPTAPEKIIANKENLLGNWAALVLPALDQLIYEGYADPERIAVTGASAGGWSVLALLTQTNRFRAGIAEHTTGNFVSYYGSSYTSVMSELFPNEIFAASPPFDEVPGYHMSFDLPPWDDPSRYIRSSPFFAVRKIQTPIMLVQSDLDLISMDQMNQMFTALFRLRKEAQLVSYWGEVHGVTSPANIRDIWARELAWIDKWCDVVRDNASGIVYEGDRPASRHGQPALTPNEFLKWTWFFGPVADASNSH